MKIAVTFENGMIFQHFGHSKKFKIYEVQDGAFTKIYELPVVGSGHGALATMLKDEGVDILICGGIGGGAQTALAEAGIKVYGGVNGGADPAVAAFVAGNLDYDPNVKCDHHDHEHDEGHTCGDHGCSH